MDGPSSSQRATTTSNATIIATTRETADAVKSLDNLLVAVWNIKSRLQPLLSKDWEEVMEW